MGQVGEEEETILCNKISLKIFSPHFCYSPWTPHRKPPAPCNASLIPSQLPSMLPSWNTPFSFLFLSILPIPLILKELSLFSVENGLVPFSCFLDGGFHFKGANILFTLSYCDEQHAGIFEYIEMMEVFPLSSYLENTSFLKLKLISKNMDTKFPV